MPKFPKPWYRKSRRRWFVQIDGRQVNLGPERKLAFARYHALMQRPKQVRNVNPNSLVHVIDAFLESVHCTRAPRTYEWYLGRLQSFAASIPPDFGVADLKPYHVEQWGNAQPRWAPGSKRNGCRAIQRAMNWAEEQGIIDRSPIAHLKKPQQGRRETILTQPEFDELLSLVCDRSFRDLLIAAWETGARPQEILALEARHVDLANARWVFPRPESKGKKFPRIVYLNDDAFAITQRLVLAHPDGPLFRNSTGRPWITDAVT